MYFEMIDEILTIDEKAKSVVWRVDGAPPFQRLHIPWGVLWRGREGGAGLEVWLEADDAFDLLMEHGGIRYFEAVTPGPHHFILTVLDSTDVA